MVNLFKYLLLKSCNTIIRKIATLILLGSFSHLVSGIYFISFNFYWNQNIQWEIYNGIGKILFWQSLCKTKENFENLMALFYGWFQLCQSCRATTRRLFIFYQWVPRSSSWSFHQPWRDKRLSQPCSYSVVLNPRPLDWQSSALTTRPLQHTTLYSNKYSEENMFINNFSDISFSNLNNEYPEKTNTWRRTLDCATTMNKLLRNLQHQYAKC